MDRIRTLLLARTHTVVLDPDRVASAATRPVRDVDVDRFEDELLQLGYVMSLDLAMTIRRLPQITDLRQWIVGTLAGTLAQKPSVPPVAGDASPYARRMQTWLHTRADQPCPWCAQTKVVGALAPCGHLVCRSCWDGGTYAGCPICHRRVATNEPFLPAHTTGPRVTSSRGDLRLVHLAFDLVAVARARFERLTGRATPLSKEDRAELEAVIDAMGPKVALWLPKKLPVKETMATAIGRLWLVAPDRPSMVKATQHHLRTATDVLRVAAVLGGADPDLEEPLRIRSVGRGLRLAVLRALEYLASAGIGPVIEDMRKRARLWKRLGERLHPFEHAERLPTAALVFAAIRGTDLDKATFGAAIVARAKERGIPVEGGRIVATPWAGPVENALRAGDARRAATELAARPGDLLRRADHLVRLVAVRQPDALADVLAAIRGALPKAAPASVIALGAHVARRGETWPRRIYFRGGDALHAWGAPDARPPLPKEAIDAIVAGTRAELLARAESRRRFARAVVDRGLRDLPMPMRDQPAPGSRARAAWPRGSEVAFPDGDTLRFLLHWEQPPGAAIDLDLSVVLFDDAWRHVATCDFTSLSVCDGAAVHSGDATEAAPPAGASEFVDLRLDALVMARVRYAVMVAFSFDGTSLDRLTHGFAGVLAAPAGAFDPRTVARRFDLGGRAMITVPLVADLAARRLRWLDVRVRDWATMKAVGGFRAALAHAGHDFSDFFAPHARPTLWDIASIHAAARANIVYVRDGGRYTTFRRREGETSVARLARIHAGEYDGAIAAIPQADAPTWIALLHDDIPLPGGSAGYVLEPRPGSTIARCTAAELVSELYPTG